MITPNNDKTIQLNGKESELSQATVENFPTLGNGSAYFCIDTGNVYIYDEADKKWTAV